MPNAFKLLKTIHMALLAGMIIFAIVSLILDQQGYTAGLDGSFERTFQVVCVLVSLSCLLIGFNLFKRKIMAARSSTAPGETKMVLYRTACIVWWAMIEGPGILATMGYLLTGNFAFMALAIFHVVILGVFMPRKQNIIVLLNLNGTEVAKLEGKQ
jgi:hypothetical protein